MPEAVDVVVVGLGVGGADAAGLLAEARRIPGMAGDATVVADYAPVAKRIRDEATDDWNDQPCTPCGKRRPVGRVTGRASDAARARRATAVTSRAVTDALLGELAAGGWRPGAWLAFLAAAGQRSWAQAVARPRTVGELAALHCGFVVLGDRRSALRVAISGGLAVTHLGMLGSRSSLGMANTLTLIRANLPAISTRHARWLGLVALGSDLLDGAIARRGGTETAFGSYADSLADAAFWIWYGGGRPSRSVRVLSVAAWALPVAAITTLSVAGGRMVDPPRPAVLRPAAALQLVLTLRALRRPYPVEPH